MTRNALTPVIALGVLFATGSSPLAAQISPDSIPEGRGVAQTRPRSEFPIVFTQLGPTGLIARAITDDATCPDIVLDGDAEPMQERAQPAPPDFPVLVCETAVPARTRHASIEGRRLPLFSGHANRIVVVGDAGCRIEGSHVQACNDPEQWPFADVAASAAKRNPDLVIHVGDYIYREDPCPPGNQGCAGSPHGDNWETLKADFFTPATALLRAAPWVFVRGNHEICTRGGQAWFRILDPRPMPATCEDYTAPYKIPVGPIDLVVLDSSITNDFAEPPEQVAAFRAQFDIVRRLVTGDSWLLTHKPLYVFGHAGVQNGVEQLFIDQLVLQQASENDFPTAIRLFIGGHIHLFETLSFGAARPPQLVVGNSGTLLDPAVTTPLTGLEMAGLPVASGSTRDAFGFVTMDRHGPRWVSTLRNVDGKQVLPCTLDDDSLICHAKGGSEQ